jgi:hypothetical protein
MQLDDADQLGATYADFLEAVAPVPYVSESGLTALLESLASDDPRLADRPASDYVDSRFVRELETSGPCSKLWGHSRSRCRAVCYTERHPAASLDEPRRR